MPIPLTYPGVYIEEVPSGVRTITGVATSIAAFVGWAPRGSIDQADRVLSWQDYERRYGGMDGRSFLGYAVNHFFANGGQDAYVMRLAPDDAAIAQLDTPDAVLRFSARNPGAWGNRHGIRLLHRSDDPTRFRVFVDLLNREGNVLSTPEAYENLSMLATDPRDVVGVIDRESSIVGVQVIASPPPTTPPAEMTASLPLTGGTDGTVLSPGDGLFETKLEGVATAGGPLDRIDLFNLLCVPGEAEPSTLQHLQDFCKFRLAVLIVDCAPSDSFDTLQNGLNTMLTGDDAINAAFYFPWLMAADPLQENRLREFPPCGFAAGIYARTDASRGVWKAPAGIDATVTGALSVVNSLTDKENGVLNIMGINCIRTFPVYGTVVWGARTLQGNDERASEWKYIPVRRTALFMEESLFRGTKWVVFEPNDEPLWAQIRLNVGAFMHSLFRQGAFAGRTPREAYFVKCDGETTTQDDINRGIVNILIGFAPLKPAEFVVIKIQQMAGQIPT